MLNNSYLVYLPSFKVLLMGSYCNYNWPKILETQIIFPFAARKGIIYSVKLTVEKKLTFKLKAAFSPSVPTSE